MVVDALHHAVLANLSLKSQAQAGVLQLHYTHLQTRGILTTGKKTMELERNRVIMNLISGYPIASKVQSVKCV